MTNNLKFKEKFVKGMTHGGLCHADEVLATALIRKFLSTDFPVDRVFSVEGTADDVLVYDIGGGQFDHHKGKKFSSYDETHELSSCGLIWETFESEFKVTMSEFAFNEISRLVKEIDDHDNGHKVSPVAIAMSNLKVPGSTPGPKDFDSAVDYMVELLNWASTPAPAEQWDIDVQRIVDYVKTRIDNSVHKEDLKALLVEESCMAHILALQDYYISLDPQYPEDWDIIGEYIGNAEKHIKYKLDCVEAVKAAPRQDTPIGNVIVLDRFVPVSPEGLKEGDVAYIAPSLRGGYNCTILTPPGKFYDYESSTVKFPRKDECVKNPTSFGLTFMHEKGFILGAETPEMIFRYLSMKDLR